MVSSRNIDKENNANQPPVKTTDLQPKQEEKLLRLLEDDEIKQKIEEKLKRVIIEELNGLSIGLRNALKDWVRKEKEKNSLVSKEDALITEGNNRSLKIQMKILEAENEKLKKQLSFKDHENRLILEALQKLQRDD